MKALVLAAALAATACATAEEPRLAADGKPARCRRVCVPGQRLPPVARPHPDPQVAALEDCCVDPTGDTWSSCAWNATLAPCGQQHPGR